MKPAISSLIHSLSQVIHDYELGDAVRENPDWLFMFIVLVRDAWVAKKDFISLESFITPYVDSFRRFEGVEAKGRLARLIYFKAHALYRNKKFDHALEAIDEGKLLSRSLVRRQREQLNLRFVLLEAAALNFKGELESSIVILEEAKNKNIFAKNHLHRANMHLNLAVYYFESGQFRKALDILDHFPNSDKWCVQNMGAEWVLKKSMVRLITEVEVAHFDAALRLIKTH